MEIKIRPLNSNEEIPFDLLLLADPSKEIVKEYLGRGQCLVALINEEMIGALVLIRTRPETIEIVNIAVQEDYQGIGIGKKLIVYSIDKAREEKAKTLEIGTGNSSVHQLMLYQRCGFRITGVDRDFFVRHYKEEIYENGIQCKDMIRLSLDL